MIRAFDLIFAMAGLVLCGPLFGLICVAGFLDTGSPLFRQQRVGRGQEVFTLVKFRSMTTDTASVASHLASRSSVTGLGHILRRTKLDELPQLWNVLKGDMSLVGPRPCLPGQGALIEARDRAGVFRVRPGITGLAQVSGVDMSVPERLAKLDARMIAEMSVKSYFRYLGLTLLGRGFGDRVRKIN